MITNLISILAGYAATRKVAETAGIDVSGMLTDYRNELTNVNATRDLIPQVPEIFQSFKGAKVAKSGSEAFVRYMNKALENNNDFNIAAMRLSALEMLNDKRFKDLFENNNGESLRHSLIKYKSSKSMKSSLRAFAEILRGTESGLDVFRSHQKAYARSIRGMIPRDLDDEQRQKQLQDIVSSVFGTVDKNQVAKLPGHVSPIKKTDKYQDQINKIDEHFRSIGIEPVYDTKKDLLMIKVKGPDGRTLQLPYLQVRYDNQSVMFPLIGAQGENASFFRHSLRGQNYDYGQIYFRDRLASSMYAPPGLIMKMSGDKANIEQAGLAYLFGGDNPEIFRIIEKAKQEGVSLDSLLFSSDESQGADEAAKLLEYIDQDAHPLLSLARKQAQIQIIDLEAQKGSAPIDNFQEYQAKAKAEGINLLPVSSPAQTSANKFLYSVDETLPDGKETDIPNPQFTEALGIGRSQQGELDIAKRPARYLTEPFKVTGSAPSPVGGGAREAMKVIGDVKHLRQMAQGNLQFFQEAGYNPYIANVAFMLDENAWNKVVGTPQKGRDVGMVVDVRNARNTLVESLSADRLDILSKSTKNLDPKERILKIEEKFKILKDFLSTQSVDQVYGAEYIADPKTFNVSMVAGSGENAQELMVNKKLIPIYNKLKSLGEVSDEERQRAIAEVIEDEKISFNEDEILGFHRDASNYDREVLKTRGSGRVTLVDAKLTEDGMKLSVGRRAIVQAGAKVESNLMKGVIAHSSDLQLPHDDMALVEKALRLLAQKKAPSKYDDEKFQRDVFYKMYAQKKEGKIAKDAAGKILMRKDDKGVAIPDWEKGAPMPDFFKTFIEGLKTRNIERQEKKQQEILAKKQERVRQIEQNIKQIKGQPNKTPQDLNNLARLEKELKTNKELLAKSELDIYEDFIASRLKNQPSVFPNISGVDFVAEPKMLLGGNIAARREQQATAFMQLAGMTGEDFYKIQIDEKLVEEMSNMPGIGSEKDAEKFLRVLTGMKNAGLTSDENVQAILGAEGFIKGGGVFAHSKKTKLNKLKSRLAGFLGKTKKADVEKVLKRAKYVIGIDVFSVRDMSDAGAGGVAKMERRFFEHAYYTSIGDDEYAGVVRDQVSNLHARIIKPDQMYVDSLKEYISNSKRAAENNLPDKSKIVDMTSLSEEELPSHIDELKKSGGYLKVKEGKTIYIPGEQDAARMGSLDSDRGRLVEQKKLTDLINKTLNAAKSSSEDKVENIEALHNLLTSEVFSRAKAIHFNPLEGALRGASYQQLNQNLTPFAAERLKRLGLQNKKGYTVGLSKSVIDKHFDELIERAGSDERAVLKNIKKEVLEGKRSYSVFSWMNPQIGPESMSTFAAYYANELDETGGAIIGRYDHNKQAWYGLLAGKTSMDFDGDKAFFMMRGLVLGKNAKTAEAEKHWKNIFETDISDENMATQFERQYKYYKLTSGYEVSVEEAIEKLAQAKDAPLQSAARAFAAGQGQDRVGRTSNRVLDLHNINYTMLQLGAVSKEEARRVTAFLQAVEQKAVGFKHQTFFIDEYLQNKVNTILDQQARPDDALENFEALLKGLGLDISLSPENKNKRMIALRVVQDNAESFAASRSVDKVTEEQVMKSAAQFIANINAELNRVSAETSEMLEDAAFLSIESDDPVRAKKIKSDAEEMIKELNRITQEEGASRAEQGAKKARVTLQEVKENMANIHMNKLARIGLIGLGVTAAAYALFNTGYDDTPLTDLPPPPPGRMGMTSGANMASIESGKLLNSYTRNQDNESIGQANIDYASSNISSPSSIVNKSYLNSATARISNRSLVLDRTSPLEYAKAIQSTIPGAQVNVNVNHRYNVPSDLEREI